MVKKVAIDWDESELRLVVAQCSGRSVKVTDACVIPIEDSSVQETLQAAISRRGLENTETLIAIGRGKAELRELQLPPVPDEELPDMVRFQAIRNFATAGDSAIVDFLVTHRSETGVEMIAAAIGPPALKEIQETCAAAELTTKRIALRPLAASALYLIGQSKPSSQDVVLIDLLADDAEIVVARQGRVIFVRTVRMPSSEAVRGRALAGELRRSLVACGSTGSLDRVVLWGRKSVHADDVRMLAEASGSQVDVLDPFTLVDVDPDAREGMPDHVGRLAPLVGLLVTDENDSERLVDFLNPRERAEVTVSPYRKLIVVGIPVAAALLLAVGVYLQMKGLDRQIKELNTANAKLQPLVDQAIESIARTEHVDRFLDGDVNWLNEIRRLATEMPPSDQLIVRGVSGTTNIAKGGGTLTIEGAVTQPSVIDQFEAALRDENHRVKGDGASDKKTEDAYRWTFTEAIRVSPEYIRNNRYAALTAPPPDPAEQAESSDVETQEQDTLQTLVAENSDAENSDAENSDAENSDAKTVEPETVDAEADEPETGTTEETPSKLPGSEEVAETESEDPSDAESEPPNAAEPEGSDEVTVEVEPEVQS